MTPVTPTQTDRTAYYRVGRSNAQRRPPTPNESSGEDYFEDAQPQPDKEPEDFALEDLSASRNPFDFQREPTPEPNPSFNTLLPLPQPIIMATGGQPAPVSTNSKEISINRPTVFDGSRKKVKTFLQECDLYLTINASVYDTDKKKIAFVLSFMNEKEALLWKEQYVNTIMDAATGAITFPTWAIFQTKVLDDFKPTDQTRDAMNKLELLRQGSKTAEELVTEFRLLVGQAGLAATTTSDNIHLIQMFRKALNPRLANRILFAETVPNTISDWYNRAIQYDSNYRMAMAFLGPRNNSRTSNSGGRTWNSSPRPQHDPNAMDIDVMSPEVRANHL